MLFAVLGFAAVVLTYSMFQSRNAMLGFPCGIFWAILGGYAYTQTASFFPPTDIYAFLAIACLLGMTPFTIFAAFGLREKRDTIADEEMERGEGKFTDEKPEKPEPKEKNWYEDDGIPEEPTPSRRASGSGRARAQRRKGEFDF